MVGYVYLTENLINSKKYIGSHKKDTFDEKYHGSGKIIKLAIKKYGADNFITTILETCDSLEDLCYKEEYWIKYYNAVEDESFYNMSYSGYMRNAKLVGKNNPFYGKHHTDETKQQMKQHHYGCSGNNNPMFGRKGGLSPIYGIKRSEETKQKISKIRKGVQLSEETKLKISKSQTGKKQSKETILKRVKANKEKGIKPPSPLGKIWITNGNEDHYIELNMLDEHIKNGYWRGRSKGRNKNCKVKPESFASSSIADKLSK